MKMKLALAALALLVLAEPAVAAYGYRYPQYRIPHSHYRSDCYCRYHHWLSVPADKVNRGTANCNGVACY